MTKIYIAIFSLVFYNSLFSQNDIENLERILNNLDKIKSASYIRKFSSNIPGDTAAISSYTDYVKMYINTDDTFVGASYTTAPINNIDEIKMCYDGIYDIRFDWQAKNVEIDTLTNIFYRRPLAPFFVKVKSLIKYAWDNSDKTEIKYIDYKDSIKISFSFKGQLVNFLWLNPNYVPFKGTSKYDLWVDKDFIPYKLISDLDQQKTWEVCSNIKISNELDSQLDGLALIPDDFTIKGIKRAVFFSSEIEGKIAADWKLKEINGDSISLSGLNSKVLLIQFTGIGCGHCHESVTFLKQLVNDYKDKDFELIGIETWSKNIDVIERYKLNNELNYKLLVSDELLKENYKIQGVPAFLILDNNRVIKKVIVGYTKGDTEKIISQTIDTLL